MGDIFPNIESYFSDGHWKCFSFFCGEFERIKNAKDFFVTQVTRFTEYVATFTVTVADEGLVNGKVYRFVFGASNAFGDSAYSLELIAGLGAVPPAPGQLTATLLKETFEAFVVSWDAVTASDLPVLGYVLLMDDGLQGDFEVAYDGSTNPQVTTF